MTLRSILLVCLEILACILSCSHCNVCKLSSLLSSTSYEEYFEDATDMVYGKGTQQLYYMKYVDLPPWNGYNAGIYRIVVLGMFSSGWAKSIWPWCLAKCKAYQFPCSRTYFVHSAQCKLWPSIWEMPGTTYASAIFSGRHTDSGKARSLRAS